MSQASTFHFKIGLFIIGLLFVQSCKEKNCVNQIEEELSKTEFLRVNNAFTLENQSEVWLISKNENQEVIESRYAYKIEIDPNSELVLLNHSQLNISDANAFLEKEFLKLVKRFEKEELKNIPNVGFQVIYSIDSKEISINKVSKTLCTFAESVDVIKERSMNNLNIEDEKIMKLLQKRFSFFPN